MPGSLADSLASLSATEREHFLASLPPDELRALEYEWTFWARTNQLPPEGAWTLWLILAGRGFGKTRIGAEWVRAEVEAGRRGRLFLAGPTAADVRDIMVEGESGILAISPPWFRPVYEPSKRRLTWPNGAIATCFSADEPERFRGPQHDGGWGDEIAAWRYPEAFDQLMFGLRLGSDPRAVFTTTPKPTKLVRELLKNAACAVTRGSTYENRANLAPAFFTQIVKKYEGTRLGRQELNAEVLEDVEGALWTLGLIEAHRLTAEQFAKVQVGRTVVAIDPNVSNTEDSDEAGVVVASRGVGACPCGKADCCYIREDRSGRVAPIEWARRSVAAYREHLADRVVAEVNNGGDLVEAQLRVVDKSVSYRAVHAAKSKRTRAEPVQALYEQGRVHHVGVLADLETQLTTWVPDIGEPSPGRLDANVWAVTDLMLNDSAFRVRSA